MKSKVLFVSVMIMLAWGTMAAQFTGDVLGMHDLSPGSKSPVRAATDKGCGFCHAPHSGVSQTPLWNKTLSKAAYTPYTSSTYHQQGNSQPPLGSSTSLCLSCHDGTIGVGETVVSGAITVTGSLYPADKFGTDLSVSHPVSLSQTPPQDSANLVLSLHQGQTADPLHAVKLIKGNVECNSCHNPHVQNKDLRSLNFLVRESSNGQMCLACHDPNRTMTGQFNRLTGWPGSIHATATNQPAALAQVGSYGTVAQNACLSCHAPHNASAGATRLLRAANPTAPTLDRSTQGCITCHAGGSNLSPAAPDVVAEFAKSGHPYTAGTIPHEANEGALLNNNRHTACADCHNPHSAMPVSSFASAPLPPLIRPSQSGVTGISASDGMTPVTPAVNQFENCLRCHGASAGKQTLSIFGYSPMRAVSAGDPPNVYSEFAANAISSHPVMHDRSSTPLSLRLNMLNLDGTTPGRSIGSRILCTDCHNSDDNREFGGAGPNGPHGSKWKHILERRYEFSQVAAGAQPGTTVQSLFPFPDQSVNGPYAMCAKCHDLGMILSGNDGISEHATHVNNNPLNPNNSGFSCSVCHTAHGMGAVSTSISGQGMVNFDIKVVLPNGGLPIAYSHASNTCTLTCHGYNHNANGSVVKAP